MAISKDAYTRFQIIDQEFCNNDYVKTSELQKVLKTFDLQVTTKTVTNDLKAMRADKKLGYIAPIKFCNSRKAYYYTNPNYTIRAFGLKEHDINALQFYAKIIDQYKGYEVFKDFSSAIEKILYAVTIRKGVTAEQARIIVQTERTPPITGSNWIPIIVRAINTKSTVTFKYQKFDDEKIKEVRLQPYLLKEDRHLWYILGKNHKSHFITYALDRVSEFEILEEKFLPESFDPEEYFKHSFGITVTDDKPINVTLSFTPLQGKYIKALPIHPTQKLISDSKSELIVTVDVKPTYEFYEKLLGYGPSIKVISPAKVVKEIEARLLEAINRYN
jgi:predicted DNA-binding transcriptional regulator YafY